MVNTSAAASIYTRYAQVFIKNESAARIFFHNRSNKSDIYNILSPLRPKLEEHVIPKLHYIGLIANFLCILTMCQKQMINRRSIVYLLHLAISDFLFIFLTELPNSLIKMKLINYDIFKVSDLTCFFYDLRSSVFHYFSVIITVIVTIDRFNAIYNPLKSSYSFLTKRPKIICLIVFMIAIILGLPRGFLYVYSPAEKDCDGRKFFKNIVQINGVNLSYYQIGFTFIEPIIIWFIPGFLILVMNAYVIYKIIKSQKARPKYLGFQNVKTRKETTLTNTQNLTNSSGIRRLRNSPTCSLDESSTPSLASRNSIDINSKASKLTKSLVTCLIYFKCKKKVNENENVLAINSPSKNHQITNGNSGQERSQTVKLQKQQKNAYNQIITYSPLAERKKNLLDRCSSNRSLTKTFTTTNNTTSTVLIQNNGRNPLRNSLNNNTNTLNNKCTKISVNQISHYITIIILGFYFILSTIPYGVLLSFQNNVTIKLDNFLHENEIYENEIWRRFGRYRDLVACTRVFFISNHCLNFFVYFLFNRMFRYTFIRLFIKLFTFWRYIKCCCFNSSSSMHQVSASQQQQQRQQSQNNRNYKKQMSSEI